MHKLLDSFTRFLARLGLIAILIAVGAKKASAQVYISEFMPAPTSGNEWVELKNTTNEAISLVGWTVEDSASVLKPIPNFDFTQSSIPAQGFFVFELKNKLNNAGDTITVKDQTGWIMDRRVYTLSSPTQSWSFNPDPDIHDYFLTTPTPGIENVFDQPSPSLEPSPLPSPQASPSITPSVQPSITPSPTATPSPSPSTSPSPTPQASPFTFPTPSPQPSPTPGQSSQPLQLSEVVACPESGEPEWVELYNPNSYQITLSSWKFKDRTGNIRTFSTDLPAQSYQIVELTSSLLNNDGDSLSILDPAGTQVTHIELPSCAAGQSTVYTQSGWQQSTTPTPYAANVFSSAGTSSSPSPTPYTMDYQLTSSATGSTSTPQGSPSLQPENTTSAAIPTNFADISGLGKVLGLTDEPSSSGQQSSQPPLPILSSSLESPGATPEAEKKSTNSTQTAPSKPNVFTKLALIFLLLFTIVCFAISGYLAYQWYTEQRAKVLLEDL